MVDKNQNRKQGQKNKKKKEEITDIKQAAKRRKNQVAKKVQDNKRKQADDKSARAKKNKRNGRKLITWTTLIGMFLGISIFLLKSDMFKICNIEITGNTQISEETILLLSEIDLEDNIFLVNTIKAKNKISQNPYIKEINIKKELPDKIKIEVIEKQKLYLLQIDEKFAYVDKNGDILEISEVKLENLILLQGYTTSIQDITPGKKLNEEDLERLEEVQKILKSSEKIQIQDKITGINIKNKNNYILDLPEYKKMVYIGDVTNLATKILRTKDIIDKTINQEGKIFVNGEFNEGFDPYFREEANN